MNNDTFYNFNEKSEVENSLKINMDELFIKKQEQDLNVLNNYNKILSRIHNKIKYISKQLINDQCCWYIVPEMLIGIPKYDHKECTVYLIEKLRENGFIVRYTNPNLLFIGWKHWVPTYVRNELKKKTGKQVDEYGNLVENNEEHPLNNDNNKKLNNLFTTKDINIVKEKKENNYNDVKNYKPSGNLIYNNNLLDKLKI
jgi:hypothetical protein